MTFTTKDKKYIDLAADASLCGTTISPTGAVLRKGKHTITGASIWERQCIGGEVRTMAMHAECSVILRTKHAMKLLPHLLRIYGEPSIVNPHVGRFQYKVGCWVEPPQCIL